MLMQSSHEDAYEPHAHDKVYAVDGFKKGSTQHAAFLFKYPHVYKEVLEVLSCNFSLSSAFSFSWLSYIQIK